MMRRLFSVTVNMVYRKIRIPEHVDGVRYRLECKEDGTVYECTPLTELLKVMCMDYAMHLQPSFGDTQRTWTFTRIIEAEGAAK